MELTEPGTDVMAPWGDDGFLYAAVVVRTDPRNAAKVLVAYWEGQSATVKASDLEPCAIVPGAKIYANHLNANNYQAAVVENRIGGAIQVVFKDGSTAWTTWVKCRTKRAKAKAKAKQAKPVGA